MWRKGCACLTQKWVKVQQCRVCSLHTNATTPLCLQRNILTPGEKMPDTHHVLAFHCSSLFLPKNAIHGVLQCWQIGGGWGWGVPFHRKERNYCTTTTKPVKPISLFVCACLCGVGGIRPAICTSGCLWLHMQSFTFRSNPVLHGDLVII